MSKKIAFVTSAVKPGFADNDLYAVDVLQSAGAKVEPLPWDAGDAAWNSFDFVVIRSCWNYHLLPDKFLQWIEKMQKDGVKVFNPLNIVRWNLHKSYLQDLESKGISIPPTIWIEKGGKADLSSLLKKNGWSKAVVKPAISATAFNTFLVSPEANQQQKEFEELLGQADLLIQKFMTEVQEEGEWSLIFFNKKFSHAVIKQPAKKDFRVQNDFGGTAQEAHPPAFVLGQAKKIIDLIDEPLLYARVDGVISENRFVLMELELIEPMLFLGESSGETFANAIANHLTKGDEKMIVKAVG